MQLDLNRNRCVLTRPSVAEGKKPRRTWHPDADGCQAHRWKRVWGAGWAAERVCSYLPSSMSSTGPSGSSPPRSSCWSRSRSWTCSCRRRGSTASSPCPPRWSWGWRPRRLPPWSAASGLRGRTDPCFRIPWKGDPLSSWCTGSKYLKICGTKSNRKNGIYSSGRRGKKEEEDAVGTLWLRLGEDQNKRKTEDGFLE